MDDGLLRWIHFYTGLLVVRFIRTDMNVFDMSNEIKKASKFDSTASVSTDVRHEQRHVSESWYC